MATHADNEGNATALVLVTTIALEVMQTVQARLIALAEMNSPFDHPKEAECL